MVDSSSLELHHWRSNSIDGSFIEDCSYFFGHSTSIGRLVGTPEISTRFRETSGLPVNRGYEGSLRKADLPFLIVPQRAIPRRPDATALGVV